MDKLIEKLKLEMREWVDGLNKKDIEIMFTLYAYEYCIKEAFIYYFYERSVPNEIQKLLMDKENVLEYLYMEYLRDDSVNTQDVINEFMDNVICKFKTPCFQGVSRCDFGNKM